LQGITFQGAYMQMTMSLMLVITLVCWRPSDLLNVARMEQLTSWSMIIPLSQNSITPYQAVQLLLVLGEKELIRL
jgi:hypothetical protein